MFFRQYVQCSRNVFLRCKKYTYEVLKWVKILVGIELGRVFYGPIRSRALSTLVYV